jgi:hypothetical protein
MTARIVFEDDEVVAVHRPGRSDFTLVTFAAIGHRPDGTWFWAHEPAGKLDLESIGVIGRRSAWYPAASMRAAAAVLRPLMRPRAIGYGYSMGGYAVLKHGAILGLSHGLAVAPQVSIDPAEVPQDQRFHRRHDPVLHAGMAVAPGDAPPVCFVAADPYWQPDAFHLDWAVRINAAVAVPMPFLRHAVISRFTSTAMLARLCAQVLEGDGAAIRQALRQGRAATPEAHVWLGREAAARGHHAMARVLWQRARALGIAPAALRAVQAAALRERLAVLLNAGRTEEVRAIAAETIDLQPPHGGVLRWIGQRLLRCGEPELAQRAFARVVGAMPQDARARLGLLEALHDQGDAAAMAQAGAAARAALADDPAARPVLARIARLMRSGARRPDVAAGPA